jgi:hypothetical protein
MSLSRQEIVEELLSMYHGHGCCGDPEIERQLLHEAAVAGWDIPGGTTHACPPDGEATMPCCGKTPFEVPRNDRMTLNDERVNCSRAGT